MAALISGNLFSGTAKDRPDAKNRIIGSQMATVDFTQGNLMRHVTVMSFTSSIGIMAIYLVDLMDIFFVSLLGHQEIAAAAGFASTIMFFVSAVSIGLSVASGSLTAQHLGQGDQTGARSVATSATLAACLVGLAVPAAMWPFLGALVGILGATGEVAELAVMYLRIVLPASALSGMSMAIVASMRAHGDAKWAMYPSLIGAGVNLVFDPLLIFGLNMELAGAATATVLARLATFGLALYAALRVFDLLARPSWGRFRRDLGQIVFYAMPAVLTSVAAPIGLAIVTRLITKYGTEAVAGLAIIGRLAPVIFAVVNALSSALGPIIGQNFGAGRHDRVRQAYFDGIKFLAVYTVVAILFLLLFRNQIADIFSVEGKTRDLLLFYSGPYALINFANGMMIVTSAAFINTGHPAWSTKLNWARNTLGMIFFGVSGSWLFGFYGLAAGILLNSALFAWLSHLLAVRFITDPQATSPAKDALDFAHDEEHVTMEMRAPIHT